MVWVRALMSARILLNVHAIKARTTQTEKVFLFEKKAHCTSNEQLQSYSTSFLNIFIDFQQNTRDQLPHDPGIQEAVGHYNLGK